MLLLSQESCFCMETCAWLGVGHGVGVSGHLLGGSDLVAGNLSAYVRRGYLRQCIQAGYWCSL